MLNVLNQLHHPIMILLALSKDKQHSQFLVRDAYLYGTIMLLNKNKYIFTTDVL